MNTCTSQPFDAANVFLLTGEYPPDDDVAFPSSTDEQPWMNDGFMGLSSAIDGDHDSQPLLSPAFTYSLAFDPPPKSPNGLGLSSGSNTHTPVQETPEAWPGPGIGFRDVDEPATEIPIKRREKPYQPYKGRRGGKRSSPTTRSSVSKKKKSKPQDSTSPVSPPPSSATASATAIDTPSPEEQQLKTEDYSDDQEDDYYNQRERNRAAASKYRARSKKTTTQLEQQEKELAEERVQLHSTVATLRNHVLFLKSELLSHSHCNCTLIQQYLAQAAMKIRPPNCPICSPMLPNMDVDQGTDMSPTTPDEDDPFGGRSLEFEC